METNEQYTKTVRQSWRDEIERAIANAKRSKLDKWFRRQWYKAEARSRWPEWRKKQRRAYQLWERRRGSQGCGTIRPANGGDWNGKM